MSVLLPALSVSPLNENAYCVPVLFNSPSCTIEKDLSEVLLPAVALPVKLKVVVERIPVTVPDQLPFDVFKDNPAGNEPLGCE